MKNLTLFLCVFLLNKFSNSENVNPRQYQILHQHHPTRVPSIINRIRERLTARPPIYHHHINASNFWQILHHNVHQTQSLNTGENNFIIPTLTTLINNVALPSTTLRPEVNSVTIFSPIFTSTTATLIPVVQSQAVTPPSFLTASSTSTIESTTQSQTSTFTDFTSQQSTTKSSTISSTSQSNTPTLTESTTISSTSQIISTSTSISSTTTNTNLCANRTALYAEGITLVKLCYISDSLNWQAARSRCLSMGYRIFEPNTMTEELALFKYIKYFANSNQFFWMNAKADIVASIANWYAYDPYHTWNYMTTSWYKLVDAPVPGTCLGVINLTSGPKFTSMSCDSFQATFWCEYN
ncbi:hypothetical protein PVAND_011969 [Polypedilum vanderplanki]|uniref:C-type lectin domain-containing protein n=1 Tax=Polypedilum vanderplanki TaxID=319348 RepID=A0A9J6CLV6_POLVA|nr:hypothetical protein PVAND_011969 [Polypedilum vanderplanki]